MIDIGADQTADVESWLMSYANLQVNISLPILSVTASAEQKASLREDNFSLYLRLRAVINS